MKREPMRTAEINIFALTEGRFRALCELIGEDFQEMARLDENPIRVWYSRGNDSTVVRYTKMRQIDGNQLGHILGITTGGTEGPVSSRRNDGIDRREEPR